jgi:hypothetical protein
MGAGRRREPDRRRQWDLSVEVTSDATIYSWTSFSDPTQQAVIEVNNQVQSGIA